MSLATVALDINRNHVARCLAMFSAQKFTNPTDEARRVTVVEKLRKELAQMEAVKS